MERKTCKELRSICKLYNLKGYSKMKKADMIQSIENNPVERLFSFHESFFNDIITSHQHSHLVLLVSLSCPISQVSLIGLFNGTQWEFSLGIQFNVKIMSMQSHSYKREQCIPWWIQRGWGFRGLKPPGFNFTTKNDEICTLGDFQPVFECLLARKIACTSILWQLYFNNVKKHLIFTLGQTFCNMFLNENHYFY